MTVASTYAKIVELVRATSGITTAVSALPDALNNDADLPLALVRVGPATWNQFADGLKRQARTYIIQTYVKPVAEGVSPDEGYQKCLPILNAMGNTFLDNPSLENTIDHIGEQGEFEDSGVVIMKHAGYDYHGFTVTLEIVDKTTS